MDFTEAEKIIITEENKGSIIEEWLKNNFEYELYKKDGSKIDFDYEIQNMQEGDILYKI